MRPITRKHVGSESETHRWMTMSYTMFPEHLKTVQFKRPQIAFELIPFFLLWTSWCQPSQTGVLRIVRLFAAAHSSNGGTNRRIRESICGNTYCRSWTWSFLRTELPGFNFTIWFCFWRCQSNHERSSRAVDVPCGHGECLPSQLDPKCCQHAVYLPFADDDKL